MTERSIQPDASEVALIRTKYARELAQPGHQLHFEVQHEVGAGLGRGFVHDPTGTVYTWPAAEASHAAMIHVAAFRDQDCTRFYIEPNGVISQVVGSAAVLMTIMEADPVLAVANGFDPDVGLDGPALGSGGHV